VNEASITKADDAIIVFTRGKVAESLVCSSFSADSVAVDIPFGCGIIFSDG
jgi:hypothetical protein